MAKRQRSSSPAPLPKRTRLDDAGLHSGRYHSAREYFPSVEEIVHLIFSHLAASDLCSIQLVSKFWNRLASDNQLWKALFLREHPLHRLRGGRSSPSIPHWRPSVSAPSRPVKPLPQRAGTHFVEQQDYKWLYRIARNWERGRCAQSKVDPSTQNASDEDEVTPSPLSPQCAILAGAYTIFAVGPTIMVYSAGLASSEYTLSERDTIPPAFRPVRFCARVSSNDGSDITAFAIDQSPRSLHGSLRDIRLAAFHQTGQIDVFLLAHDDSISPPLASPAITLIYRTSPAPLRPTSSSADTPSRRRPEEITDVVSAAYHHPMLITLSKSFHLTIYHLPELPTLSQAKLPLKPLLIRSIHSFTSFLPASMTLTRAPAPIPEGGSSGMVDEGKTTFKLVLAYTIAVWPAHWTVGAAELTISVAEPSQLHASSSANPSRTHPQSLLRGLPDVRVISSRTASAIPTGWAETPVGLATSVLAADHDQDEGDDSEDGDGNTDNLEPLVRSSATAASGSGGGGGMYSRPSAMDFRSSFSSTFRQQVQRPSAYERALEQWNRKVGNVVGTQTDGKWVVIAGSDNVLQVYRLHRPSSLRSSLSLTYARSLYGHTAGIVALRVADGRCVSLGREGRVWVWNLEDKEGRGVCFGADGSPITENDEETPARNVLVLFDETQVVTCLGRNGVDCWRFDL